MKTHHASALDSDFVRAFEAGEISPAQFDHRAHLRLAYVYLVGSGIDTAEARMRAAIRAFLESNGIPADKFHVTLTRAWIEAVRHFMNRSESASFAEFMANSQPLVDSKVMLTHYSPDLLFSAKARAGFVSPDREAIP